MEFLLVRFRFPADVMDSVYIHTPIGSKRAREIVCRGIYTFFFIIERTNGRIPPLAKSQCKWIMNDLSVVLSLWDERSTK